MAKSAETITKPLFTKAQLICSKTIGLPRDILSVVLKEDASYTKDQATRLVSAFLERKV